MEQFKLARLYGASTYLVYNVIISGAHNTKEIGEVTGLDRRTLTTNLSKLVAGGYITKTPVKTMTGMQHEYGVTQ